MSKIVLFRSRDAADLGVYRGMRYQGTVASIANINAFIQDRLKTHIFINEEHTIDTVRLDLKSGKQWYVSKNEWILRAPNDNVYVYSQDSLEKEFYEYNEEAAMKDYEKLGREVAAEQPAIFAETNDFASNHEEQDLDEAVPLDEEHLAWDVIPAKEPVKQIAISTIIGYLNDGFDRSEIAVMIGHSVESVNKLFKKYPALHNRKAAKSNRLPFKVVEDVIKEEQQSINSQES